jgi:hypothetical protein
MRANSLTNDSIHVDPTLRVASLRDLTLAKTGSRPKFLVEVLSNHAQVARITIPTSVSGVVNQASRRGPIDRSCAKGIVGGAHSIATHGPLTIRKLRRLLPAGECRRDSVQMALAALLGWLVREQTRSDQSGYSSFRQERGSAGWAFGVRSSRKLKYGATNGSGADTV